MSDTVTISRQEYEKLKLAFAEVRALRTITKVPDDWVFDGEGGWEPASTLPEPHSKSQEKRFAHQIPGWREGKSSGRSDDSA